jgi:hypothetical protein
LFVLKTVMGGCRRRECWVLRVIPSASGQGELRVHRKRRWPGPAASYKTTQSCRDVIQRNCLVGAGADRDGTKAPYHHVKERASPGCPLLLRNSPWPTAMGFGVDWSVIHRPQARPPTKIIVSPGVGAGADRDVFGRVLRVIQSASARPPTKAV